jgi:hypothetical protein
MLMVLAGVVAWETKCIAGDDGEQAQVEINVGSAAEPLVEVNGRHFPDLGLSGRYLFAQQHAQEEPPLPPSQFNPDRAAGIVSNQRNYHLNYSRRSCQQPPEYGTESVPRSLGLPRRGVVKLNLSDENLIINLTQIPREESASLPDRKRCQIVGSSDSVAGNGTLIPPPKHLTNPAGCGVGIHICRVSLKEMPLLSDRTFSLT